LKCITEREDGKIAWFGREHFPADMPKSTRMTQFRIVVRTGPAFGDAGVEDPFERAGCAKATGRRRRRLPADRPIMGIQGQGVVRGNGGPLVDIAVWRNGMTAEK
jgi:hypothetical protein